MRGIRISSRYAKSLLDLAIEKHAVEEVYADMKRIRDTIRGSKELSVFLNSPVIKADKKNDILNSIFGGSTGKITMGFITLLTNKGRESLLKEVTDSFISQVKDFKHIGSAEVTTAQTLDKTTLEQIHAVASRLASGEVELVQKINPEVIGGFVLKVGDKMIDTTISGKIKKLQREFDENPYVPEL